MSLSKFCFYFSLISGVFCSMAWANPLSVSEKEINDYLSQKAQIQDQVGIPGLLGLNYKLENLSTKIGQTEQKRVEIAGTADAILTIQQQKMAGKINLLIDTVPYYESEKGAVYLKDIRILQWSGEPESYMAQLQGIMPLLSKSIAALMATIPIYTLDESKPRDILIKKFAKGIKVEKGEIVLEASLF